jgi:hypothetical protein
MEMNKCVRCKVNQGVYLVYEKGDEGSLSMECCDCCSLEFYLKEAPQCLFVPLGCGMYRRLSDTSPEDRKAVSAYLRQGAEDMMREADALRKYGIEKRGFKRNQE